MNPEECRYFARKLRAEQEGLITQIKGLEESGIGQTLAGSTSELSMYDNHPADLGSEVFERGKDIALRDNAQILLEKVEEALERVTKGTYGQCEKCGKEIPIDRLEAVPWANECIDCQQLEEVEDPWPRPIEEEFLGTPFNRTFLDYANSEYVGFDGEDALQAVLRYGSSDTPQDIPGTHDYKDLFPNSEKQEGIVDPADAIPNANKEHTRTAARQEL